MGIMAMTKVKMNADSIRALAASPFQAIDGAFAPATVTEKVKASSCIGEIFILLPLPEVRLLELLHLAVCLQAAENICGMKTTTAK
jgi:hypothetical protein